MLTRRPFTRSIVTAGLMLVLSITNLFLRLPERDVLAAGVQAGQSEDLCCCGTKDDQCCGLLCCGISDPNQGERPRVPDRPDKPSEPPASAVASGSDVIADRALAMRNQSPEVASSAHPSLITLSVRLDC